MKKKALGSKKLHWQYFLSYLAVMLTVMVILLSYAYESFYRFHSQILLANNTNSLNLIRESNESELRKLGAVAGQCTTAGVAPFSFGEEPERALQVIRQLANYGATNDFIEGIYVSFYDDEYVYSTISFYLLNNFVSKAALFEKLTGPELLNYLNFTNRLTVLPEQNVKGYIFNATSIPTRVIPVFLPIAYPGGARCGTVMFLVSKQTYTNMFSRIVAGDKNVYMLSGDQLIVSQEPHDVPFDVVLAAAKNAEETTVALQYGGQEYRLIIMDGQAMNYRYFMLVPGSELAVAMAGTLQMMVIVAAVVSALGLLVIMRVVQSRIKPIRLLYGMLSDREPSGNELIEIRDGVQKLIDKNASLNTQMENVEGLRKADFARRFASGGFDSVDEWLSAAEGIQLNVDMRLYAVCILAKPVGSDYELLPEKLNHLFDETVSGVSRSLGMFNKVMLIAFANDEGYLYDWLEAKLAGLRACCTGVTMAVSAVHTDYREGPHAYLEADYAFESRFIKGNMNAIRFLAVGEAGQGNAQYNPQVVERLRLALRMGDAGRVRGALDEISHAMRTMNTSLFTFRCMYNDIIRVVSNEAQQDGASGAQEVYDLFTLSQCLSLDDLDVMLHNACARLIKDRVQTMPKAEEEAPAIVGEAMDIILKRFSEPGFSVSAIAQELGVSDSKLSVDFKKAYQMTPLECITLHRMRQARRLLRTTDMPVKDIAIECGYYDISGFNRRFKAYTGQTPQQHRQNNEEAGEEKP